MTGTGEDGNDDDAAEDRGPRAHTPSPPRGPAGTPLPGIASAHPEALADVLASIRTLVSAEAAARLGPDTATDGVLMLTPEMRTDAPDDGPELDIDEDSTPGQILSHGLGGQRASSAQPTGAQGMPAPILDEESLRAVINAIVREELQGELGDRIGRNLRKLIRRELAEMRGEIKSD